MVNSIYSYNNLHSWWLFELSDWQWRQSNFLVGERWKRTAEGSEQSAETQSAQAPMGEV